jgi:F-type H+-transporting ATPase subunit c
MRSSTISSRSATPAEKRKETLMGGSLNMVGYGLAAIGPGIGIGLIFAAYINGTARQPEMQSRLQPIAILGFALAEALAIIGIALAFVLKAKNS